MLTSRRLVATPVVTVSEVRCRGEGRAWSEAEPVAGYGAVLVRAGVFRRRVGAEETVLDAGAGYLRRPDSEQRIAHPLGGDVCTSLVVDEPSFDRLTGGSRLPRGRVDLPVFPSPAADLGHRALAARAAAGAPDDELAERAVVVLGQVLADVVPEAVRAGFPAGYPAATPRVRRTVDGVREALSADPGLALGDLAAIVGLSPYHLSRVFRRVTGLTLSRYRGRLRVRHALERLTGGERDLATLAVEAGFADQAHLTRAVRIETGRTPGALRRMLSGP